MEAFKQTWNKIIHSIPLRTGLIVVILLPAIFGGVFLGSLWDPFGESGNLQAAVVNNDKTVEFNDKDIHIGDTLVEKLKDVDDMQFVETNANDAQEGLRSGKYAMIVTIPKDFSKNAATLLDKNPKKMKLNIETNPGINYLTHNIADNASKEIKTKVTKEVNKKYSEALFDAMEDMEDGFKTARNKSSKLVDGVANLKDGYTKLNERTAKLASGANSMKTGSDSMQSGINSYLGGVDNLSSGTSKLITGSNNLSSGVGKLGTGVTNLESGSDSLAAGVGNLSSGVDNLSSGSDSLNSGVNKLANGVDNLKNGSNSLSTGVSNLSKGVGNLESGASSLSSGTGNLMTGIGSLESGANNLSTGVDNLSTGVNNLESGANGLDFGISSLKSNLPAESQVDQLQSGLSGLSKKLSGADGDGVTLTKQEAAQYAQLLAGANNALGGYSKVRSGADKLASGSENLLSGVSTLKSNTEKLESGASSLSSGVKTLKANTSKLESGAKQLDSGVNTLKKNTKKLQNGSKQLSSGVKTLKKNTKKLKSGSDSLSAGVSTLKTNTGKLQEGTNSLTSGVSNLALGMGKLESKSSKLDDGIDTANDKLGNVSKATYNQAGTPVKRVTSEMTSVDNFGNSMAAFMLTIGLWVGSMAFCMMYPIGQDRKRSGLKTWAKDAVVMIPVATVFGLAILPLMKIFLAINPVNVPATLLVAVLAALAFVSIIYFVNIAVGKPGMAIVLVLLCLQLAACGGIFDTSMTTAFYQALHPFMPFTYSVEAFRSTIANGNSILVPCLVLAGIAIGFNALSILKYHRGGQEIVENAPKVDVAAQLAAMGIKTEG